MTNLDSKTHVWYPAHSTKGGGTKIDKTDQSHIEYGGTLLCHQSKEALLSAAKADKHVSHTGALPGHFNMCPKCQEVYKTDPRFPWGRWFVGVEKPFSTGNPATDSERSNP